MPTPAGCHEGLAILACADAAEWDQRLADNYVRSTGVWLKLSKKTATAKSVGKDDAIAVAIGYGWIDGRLDGYDEHAWLVRFTPRGPRSKWSQRNRGVALRMIDEGRMHPAGMREVERARADGRWEGAYPSQGKAEVPADFAAALSAAPEVRAFFETLSGANRYALLYRLHNTKTGKARAARIAEFIAMLGRGETFH